MTTNPPTSSPGLDMDAIYATARPARATTHNGGGSAMQPAAASVLSAIKARPGITSDELLVQLPRLGKPALVVSLKNLRQWGHIDNRGTRRVALWHATGKTPNLVARQQAKMLTQALSVARPPNAAGSMERMGTSGLCAGPNGTHAAPNRTHWRTAIEAALLATTEAQTMRQLAETTGAPLERVRQVISDLSSGYIVISEAVPGANKRERGYRLRNYAREQLSAAAGITAPCKANPARTAPQQAPTGYRWPHLEPHHGKPDANAHELCGSRRGNDVLPYSGVHSQCVGELRDKQSLGRG